jgi:thiopeptide-type bacteriocin biosynthesis protein
MTRRDTRLVVADGFFVWRCPLLPLDELADWGRDLATPDAWRSGRDLGPAIESDCARLRERMRVLAQRPEVMEAMYLGSPALIERLPVWLSAAPSDKTARIESAVLRYLLRMLGRSTPFGLFASVAAGTVSDRTALRVPPRDSWRRHVRLDYEYLVALTDSVSRRPEARQSLRYRPNSTLYRLGQQYRYVEVTVDERHTRQYRLSAVDASAELSDLVAAFAEGASPGDVARRLSTTHGIDDEEAAVFVGELIDAQVFVPSIEPPLTGTDALAALTDALEPLPGVEPLRAGLRDVHERLAALNRDPLGVPPDRYRALMAVLKDVGVPPTEERLVHVDLHQPAECATIGPSVVAEIERAADVLWRFVGALRGPVATQLDAFAAKFIDRYGTNEVPLMLALDEDTGIKWGASTTAADDDPVLVDTKVLPNEARQPRKLDFARRLAAKLCETWRDGKSVMRLENADLPPAPSLRAGELAGRAAAFARVAAAGPGAFQVYVQISEGCLITRLAGRFCHGDEVLAERLRAYARAEADDTPGAVHAEIVHLPVDRAGNFIARPIFRSHEIPYLGVSGCARAIGIGDLLVSVRDGHVILRSAALGCRVIPHLANAHAFTAPGALGAYSFLSALETQMCVPTWSWGVFADSPMLPRVETGRAVLSLARWRLEADDLKPATTRATRYAAVQRWRERWGVPRFVSVAQGDQGFPLDLDHPMGCDLLVTLVRKYRTLGLEELFLTAANSAAHGVDGAYAHELIVPLSRTVRGPSVVSRAAPADCRPRFEPPGGPWMYFKVYTGRATADRLLAQRIGPLIRQWHRSGVIDRWFFIRYEDPDFHLRLRMHGDPATLLRVVAPALSDCLAGDIEAGAVARTQLDTYAQEVERFGGPRGLAIAESMFHADSEAVLSVLRLGPSAADRYRWGLFAIDRLMTDAEMPIGTRSALCWRSEALFGLTAGGADPREVRRAIAARFRREREHIAAALAADDRAIPAAVRAAFDRRSESMRTGFGALGSVEILADLMHLHVNRLVRDNARRYETTIYGLLASHYESHHARELSARAMHVHFTQEVSDAHHAQDQVEQGEPTDVR